MLCRDCHRYDSEARKCLDGKLNPHTWEHTVNASNVFGIRSICVYCDFREKLVRARGMSLESIESFRKR